MQADPAGRTHLRTEEVAAYLDNGLSRPERRRVERHLASCDECRGEIIEVNRLLAAPPRMGFWQRRRVPVLGALAAAALAAVLVLRVPPPDGIIETVRVAETADSPDGPVRITVITPRPGVEVEPGAVEFAWHSIAEGALYRFTLADESGEPLWSLETRDTLLTVPTDVMRRAADYFWHVDALLPDGRSATTRVQRVATRP